VRELSILCATAALVLWGAYVVNRDTARAAYAAGVEAGRHDDGHIERELAAFLTRSKAIRVDGRVAWVLVGGPGCEVTANE